MDEKMVEEEVRRITALLLEDERIELKHQAHTREVFIAGVIRAIRYIPNAEKGIVSSMNDVLGLE